MNARIRDLSAVDGPLLVFGGPYGNLEATRAMQAEAARLGFPRERVLCTGDLVAYCADPAETAALVRDWGIGVVMGNVEEQLGAAAADCACGFTAGSACDRLAAAWYAHADRQIDAETRRWMAGLPGTVRFALGGRRLAAVHGAPSRINRFVFGSTPADDLAAEIDLTGADGVLGGHCGLPFTVLPGGRLWHNAGAIGLPANDGTPRVWFSVLTPGADGIVIDHVPLTYDHAAAAAKLRRAGLPETYARALETGLWPPVDFLPPAEEARRGRPLVPWRAFWPNPVALAAE
jgi:hypothetical protein